MNTINQFSDFFRFDSHAHFVTFLVYIAGLFEKNKRTINLQRLKHELISANLTLGSDLAEIECLFSQAAPLANKAAILRNNAIAHRTAGMSYNDVFREAAVTPNQLRELTEFALKITNCFLVSTNQKQQHFRDTPRLHLKGILEVLEANPIDLR